MVITRHSLLLYITLVLLSGCATSGGENKANTEATQSTAEANVIPQPEVELTSLSVEQRELLDTLVEVMRAGEWLAAREMAQELILAHPLLAEGYANMGNIHLQLKDVEKAEQAWLKALELHPGWPAVCNRVGIFYRQQGRFDESLAMYQQALSSDDSYANAHRNIAILYEIYRGEYDKALQHYHRYLALIGGEDREVSMWIADLERRAGSAAR